MGDRFYLEQSKHKPKRILKADIIIDLQSLLGAELKGLDKLTVLTLKELILLIENL